MGDCLGMDMFYFYFLRGESRVNPYFISHLYTLPFPTRPYVRPPFRGEWDK